MRQFSGMLLIILVSLLFGLSPLQGALISFSDSFGSQGETHPMVDTFDSGIAVSSSNAMIQECWQCDTNDDHMSHSRSSNQCTTSTCVLAPPAITSHPANPATVSVKLGADEDAVRLLASSLFRPPKVLLPFD